MGVADFLYSKMLDEFAFEPTPDQVRLFRRLADFTASDQEEDLLVINGYAGTGKTSSIAAYVKTLLSFELKFKLMAPTGRSAKVLAGYTGQKSATIHKTIYRQRSMNEGVGQFSLNINKAADTVFIVDEASLIAGPSAGSPFGTGDLLSDLLSYVRNGLRNRLILIGDAAQLPPVSMDRSPALDADYLQASFGCVEMEHLSDVVRQGSESGILHNATLVRQMIQEAEDAYGDEVETPVLDATSFADFARIQGGDLIEKLTECIDRYGLDETVVLCRSNKRANRYNAGIRGSVLYREEQLCRGDKLMVVKNCYQFLEQVPELDFIANGDVAQLLRIRNYEERYGLHFAEADLCFSDYNDVEIRAKVILDTLSSEAASLTADQQRQLYEGVYEDHAHLKTKRKIQKQIREDPYYNALQIKYAAAITCHKSQGGQWKAVFVDNPFWQDPLVLEDLKWLYTAITRGVEQVYLVNFNDKFFKH